MEMEITLLCVGGTTYTILGKAIFLQCNAMQKGDRSRLFKYLCLVN